MDPTSGDKPGEGKASAVTSQTVTRRIKWPEPGPAPKPESRPPEPPSRRANMLWYAAAGGVVIVCAVAIVAMRRHAPESVTAAPSPPKAPLPAVIQKPAPEVEPLPKPTTLAAVQAPKPVIAPAEPAPKPTTAAEPVKPPSPYEAAVAEGEQAFAKRQLDRARAAFDRAARARPGAAVPEYGLGRCLVQEGDPAGAADHFRRAARAGLVESWFDLGEAQRVLSQNDDALESYRKYLASGGGKHAGRARKLVAELGGGP